MKIFSKKIKGEFCLNPLEPAIFLMGFVMIVATIVAISNSYIESKETKSLINEINQKHESFNDGDNKIVTVTVDTKERCANIIRYQKDKNWSKIVVNSKELESMKVVEIVTKCDDSSKDNITIEFKI